MKKKNVIALLGLCLIIIIGSYVVGAKVGGEFGGADDQIEDTIKGVDNTYEPWFSSVWEPPSGEIESLLFAAQAALGAGFLGYYIGKKKHAKTNNGTIKQK